MPKSIDRRDKSKIPPFAKQKQIERKKKLDRWAKKNAKSNVGEYTT